jgi:hypothetical protein
MHQPYDSARKIFKNTSKKPAFSRQKRAAGAGGGASLRSVI